MPPVSDSVFEKPFILSMGPQRAGTSWLDRYLRTRNDVCLPAEVKEVFFFDRHYHRGVDFYKSHFKPLPRHRYVMEVSTTSFDAVDAPRHVHEVFGSNLKMLCPLRHPVTRSYSLYLHYKRYGMVEGTLQMAVRDNPQIVESSRYAKHLKRWYAYFDPAQIQFLFLEDLERNHLEYVERICAIFGLDVIEFPPDVAGRYNNTSRAPFPALAKAVQYSADYLRQHRAYGVINAAKAMGLKPLIFGGGGEGGQAETDSGQQADITWLSEQLCDEVAAFEALTAVKTGWDITQQAVA